MNFTLFPYQTAFVDQLRAGLAKHRSLIACLPTGGGKTKIFTSITLAAYKRGRTVLILTESTAIYSQILEEVGKDAIRIGDGVKEFYPHSGKVYVAMVQTLARRPLMLAEFAKMGRGLLVIADEAHIGTHKKVLAALDESFLLGFTATPDYRVAKHLPGLYQDCIVGAQVGDLIGLNRLSPYRHFERKGGQLDRLVKKAGEFTEESQAVAFLEPESIAVLIKDVRQALSDGRKKVMIYTSSIAACRVVVTAFRESGVMACEVHSKNPHSEFELYQFEEGDHQVCVSVGSLTKGYDFPAIDCIILYRATTSLALYLQMIGRGGRVMEAKKDFLVLDYGGNGTRHGRWDMSRDWSGKWNGKDRSRGAGGGKLCPKCLALNVTSAEKCSECGHSFVTKQKKKKTLEGTQLVELGGIGFTGRMVSSLSPEELLEWSRVSKKTHFAWRIARTQGDRFLAKYATVSGYSGGWVRRQGQEETGFKDFKIK